jgi:hypothetical protein
LSGVARPVSRAPARVLCALACLPLLSCASLGVGGIGGDDGASVAQVERFEIISRAPAFEGATFDDAGDYETIVAVAHMKINPRAAANKGIVDLDKAATVGGWVRYDTDVVIVRPRDAAKASGVLLLDVPNRGGKLFQVMANEGAGALDAAGVGNGFTMRRGHTLVWVGWQGDIALARDGSRVGTAFPHVNVAGPSMEEKVFDDVQSTGTMALAWPAATQERARASLTVRATPSSAPTVLPADAWRYTSARAIELQRVSGFDMGAIYQFRYEASDPAVMGLGFAALRDVTSFLKAGAPDGAGQANPLADLRPAVTIAVGVSQSGRVLRDLIWQGFNADPRGGKVFDGAMPLIAGSRKSFVNARFAQPGRYSTQHLDHITYGDQFPFTYGVTRDPVGGQVDGIFASCQRTATCPKLMHVDSSLEFWQARASLIVTDGAGHDIALPPDVRAYLMASTQHMRVPAPTVGICAYPNNTAQQGPTVRVLLDRLVAWTRSGAAPPPSRYPRLADNMLTAPNRDAVGFPDLRAIGIGYPQVINGLALVDYSVQPPRVDATRQYEVLVPMADADGHDIAGVRLPDVAVPLATYAGWNLRRKGFAEGELCGLNGMSAPLAATPRAGDPRPALSQRYASRLEYAKAVALAARALRDDGLLLDEDVTRFIERAKIEQRVKQ